LDSTLTSHTIHESASSLEDVLDSLISSLRDSDKPIPLPTYKGLEVQQNFPTSETGHLTNGRGEQQGKYLSWSRGLGMELSPIKTQSACKKIG
jgi:hypothetical protein